MTYTYTPVRKCVWPLKKKLNLHQIELNFSVRSRLTIIDDKKLIEFFKERFCISFGTAIFSPLIIRFQ